MRATLRKAGACVVQDLVAGRGEGAKQPVQVALRLWAEEELGLLDQEHEAADAHLEARVQPPAERDGRRCRGRGRPLPADSTAQERRRLKRGA